MQRQQTRNILLAFILALALLASGCRGGNSDDATSEATDGRGAVSDVVLQTFDTVTGAQGESEIDLGLATRFNKFSVTASTGASVSFDYLLRSDGTFYANYLGERMTAATSFGAFSNTAVAPSRDFDPAVAGGNFQVKTTTVRSFVSDSNFEPAPGEPVNYTVVAHQDPDLNSGPLTLNIIYVGAIPQLPANKAAVQAAIGVARTILQGAGIAATFNEFDFAGGDVVTNPYFGSELYLNISAAVPSPAVNVCIAADFDITGLLGISGGLPGSPLPGARSCVGISVLNNAGVGGVYGAPELNLLGETLAHETGHYLGLFHPVETDWVTLDPLPDTAACAGQADCVSKIQNNLMFPLPILDGLGNYVTQNQLTPQQAGVMNRHSAVF